MWIEFGSRVDSCHIFSAWSGRTYEGMSGCRRPQWIFKCNFFKFKFSSFFFFVSQFIWSNFLHNCVSAPLNHNPESTPAHNYTASKSIKLFEAVIIFSYTRRTSIILKVAKVLAFLYINWCLCIKESLMIVHGYKIRVDVQSTRPSD